MNNTICKVCNGAGGWKTTPTEHLGENWMDCILCDGFGFYKESEEELEKATLLDYTKHTSALRAEFERFGRVFAFESDDHGTKIGVNIVPSSRETWIKIVKRLLFLSSENNLCSAITKQVFFYDTDRKYKYYWEVRIEVKDISDLEILADYLASLELEGETKNV